MSDLVANVVDGKLENNTSVSSTKKTTTGTTELGKEAFLQLLVCQMQNQDPLNPSTDTEYVAQLAQFSQLEQLQNLASTTEQSQAFSLVGKTVTITDEDSNGKKFEVDGKVDYVIKSSSALKLSINGNLYDFDKLTYIYDSDYVSVMDLPSVEETKLEYDASSPSYLSFNLNMGNGDSKASDIAVIIDGTILDTDYFTLSSDKVIINRDALKNVVNGDYDVTVIFNDSSYTTASGKITISVINSEYTGTNIIPSASTSGSTSES